MAQVFESLSLIAGPDYPILTRFEASIRFTANGRAAHIAASGAIKTQDNPTYGVIQDRVLAVIAQAVPNPDHSPAG
jgi:hypothetical protein